MINKVFNRVTLCSLVALAIGIGTTAIMVTGLSIAGAGGEEADTAAMTASYIINFPENEQMLNAISADMLADKAVVLGLPDIAPAAGDVSAAQN